MGLAIVAITVLHFLLQKTKLSKAMRAVGDNIDLARVSGINVEKVVLWTWVITGELTTLGGVMYGPIYTIVILGRIGNSYEAILGGLVVSIVSIIKC